jgi:hypothetical protein
MCNTTEGHQLNGASPTFMQGSYQLPFPRSWREPRFSIEHWGLRYLLISYLMFDSDVVIQKI